MASESKNVRHYCAFIDGVWTNVVGSDDRIERHSPVDGTLVATYAAGGAADIDRAVTAARAAFANPTWAGLSPRDRSQLLLKAADQILAAEDDLAAVEAAETGKPLAQALSEIRGGAELWRYAAAALRTQPGEVYPALAPTTMGVTVIEPVGVVGLVLPWNFPFIVAAERLPFILAAGCTVVAKPSEYAGGTCLLMGEILKRAGFPDGVYNAVTGAGAAAGAALVEHPDVAMISFTGSTANGRQVMAAASRTLKRVSLELGGKSPVVVFADADLEAAADAVILGFTHNAGQCCIATSRLLVEETVADRFLALLAAKLDRSGNEQPVAMAAQFDKVRHYLELGRTGDRVVYDGAAPAEGPGYFVAPAIFETASTSPVSREEVFGPVLAVHRFRGDDHAVELANDTEYGLAAAVWSGDQARAWAVARRIRAGRLWINSPQENFPELPVGGYGASGIGREAGRSGILAYSEIKSIIIGTPASKGTA